jgi:hypothetical protein
MMRSSSRAQASQRNVTSSAFRTDAEGSVMVDRIGFPHFGQVTLRRAMEIFFMSAPSTITRSL